MANREITWSGPVSINFSISMSNVSAGTPPNGGGPEGRKINNGLLLSKLVYCLVRDCCGLGLGLDLALDA
jgi:hypothetical protein